MDNLFSEFGVSRPPPPLLPPFEGPLLKIRRAANVLQELKKALTAEQIAVSPTGLGQLELNGASLVIGGHQMNDQIPLLIGDVIHNLRTSLDIAVGDFARVKLGLEEQFSFPFRKDEESLKSFLEKGHRKLGKEICDLFLEYRPFKGGNLLLRSLHDLDVMDKHKIVLPFLGLPQTKDALNPYLWSGSDDCHFAIMICFQGPPLDMAPLVPTLHSFFEMTHTIVKDIAQICGISVTELWDLPEIKAQLP